ncbi:MAG: Dipeptide transport system permease protein DppC [Candidatus Marinimicrobia bacterium]|nr:Dipeptide transport system permease protein DppC [Candidatus Neomarinimicrobiota bacterium]
MRPSTRGFDTEAEAEVNNQELAMQQSEVRFAAWEYLFPGVSLILRGRKGRGAAVFAMFLIPLIFFIWQPGTIFSVFTGAAWDIYLASIYLFLLFLASFWVNIRLLQDHVTPDKKEGISEWQVGMRRFKKNNRGMFGLVILIFLYSVALLAPLISPHDPISQKNVLDVRFLSPSLTSGYLLGTDGFGRDLLSRIIFGSRISLFIGFVSMTLSVGIGSIIGVIGGYFGGWIDGMLMRLVDLMLGFPRLFLILIVIAFVGPSIFWIIAVLGLTGWMGVARLVRGQVLSLKEQEFILATKALGVRTFKILFRHLIPNAIAPIIVYATLNIGIVILVEAGLSFLGLGVQPPTPSWGNIVDLGRKNLIDAWWIATFPGFAIVITVVSFNIVGDALRDAFDPRLRD